MKHRINLMYIKYASGRHLICVGDLGSIPGLGTSPLRRERPLTVVLDMTE